MSFYDTETRRIVFDCGDVGKAIFIPRCKCGFFCKPHKEIFVNDYGLSDRPNADCKRCGATHMVFEGFSE